MKKSDLNPFLRTLFYLHPIDVYIIDAEQKQDKKMPPEEWNATVFTFWNEE